MILKSAAEEEPHRSGVGSASISAQFVGRERELDELRTVLSSLTQGHGRLLLVSGEPGSGKTRLVEELVKEAGDHPICVAWGRCWEAGGAPPYWPWVQILRTGLASAASWIAQVPHRQRGELGQILPEIEPYLEGESLPRPNPADADQESARFRLHDAATTLLRTWATQQPLLLVLEDLHAADLPSLRLLRFLVHGLFALPVSVVGTIRAADVQANPDVAPQISELARDGHVIPLAGLSADEVNALIGRVAGRTLPEVAASIHALTAGNPLFVTEILRVMIAERRLDAIDEAQMQRTLPQRVVDATLRHLRPLPERTRAVLAAASVLGKDIEIAVLERMLDRIPDVTTGEVMEPLQLALAGGVIVSPSSGRFSFSHALVRDTLYSSISTERRNHLHEVAAKAVEAVWSSHGQPPFAEIAHHYLAAGPARSLIERAMHFSRMAGDQAMQRFAFENARLHYQRALECLDRLPAASDTASTIHRADLMQALAWALRQSGSSDQARATFLDVAKLAREAGAVDLFARAAIDLEAFGVGKYSPQQVALLEEALTALPPGDSAVRARTQATLSMALYHTHDLDRRERLSREAFEMARRLDDPLTVLRAFRCRELALWVPEYLDYRVDAARAHLALAHQHQDTATLRPIHIWLVLGAMERGEVASAEATMQDYWRIEGTEQDLQYLWIGSNWRFTLAQLRSRLNEAEELANKHLQLGMQVDHEFALAAYGAQMLVLAHETGGLEQYLANVEPALLQAPADRFEVPAILAMAYAETGRLQQAKEQFERLAADDFAGVPKDLNWLAIMAMLANTCFLLSDRQRAVTLCRLLQPFAGRVALISIAVATWGSVGRFLGLLCCLLEEWEQAESHFLAAIRLHEEMGAPGLWARSRVDYAQMQIRAERRTPHTTELLRSAHAEAIRLGMHRLATHAESLLALTEEAVEQPLVDPESQSSASLFRQEGEIWLVGFAGTVARFRHSRGFALLAHLVRHPGREIHALELLSQTDPVETQRPTSDAGEVADGIAIRSYRVRLAELREELREAEEISDAGRREVLQVEMDQLTEELTHAVGLGGRQRRTGSTAERARVNVTRAISLAMRKVRQHHPRLAEHFDRTIHTGTFCCYAPDPRLPVDWSV